MVTRSMLNKTYYLVANPENRFSRDVAHFRMVYQFIAVDQSYTIYTSCIHRSLFIELWFSKKKASFLENPVCKKGQVKVTLFPGMVFQERILF